MADAGTEENYHSGDKTGRTDGVSALSSGSLQNNEFPGEN